MKVCIIAFGVMDSTIPLSKHLSLLPDVEIDMYCVLTSGDQLSVFEFKDKQPNGFVDPKSVKNAMGENIYKYLSTLNTKIYIYPDRWFQKIFFKDIYYAYLFTKYINKKKYDTIHIIHTAKTFWFFLYFFLNRKIVQTLHEVTSHEEKTSTVKKWILKLLIKNSNPVIVQSDISKERFIKFRELFFPKISNENTNNIRFGLYETYPLFANKLDKANNNKINILNFGRFVPYKGIHFLIEAVKILQNKYPIHLIVAGSGTPYFDLGGIRSYELINKFLSNEEIVKLIQESEMVVLPYLSASQSGIPMTVFPFKKPVIASNLPGFREVIENGKTGLLVDNLNAHSLASSIETLIVNSELKQSIINNIKKKYSEGEFSWPFIAKETFSFYKKNMKSTNEAG
jgi:glycosyltransferase involved in cell wall biosynthesis